MAEPSDEAPHARPDDAPHDAPDDLDDRTTHERAERAEPADGARARADDASAEDLGGTSDGDDQEPMPGT
jgi:hypothetical protein